MIKIIIVCALCLNAALLGAKEMPDWFTPLLNAVYDGAGDAAYIARLGNEVEERAKQELSGADMFNMLSYSEFLIAKAYLTEKNDDEAERRFQQGLDYAYNSVEDKPTAEGYRMIAENISQLCTLKPAVWVIANGLKVEQYAKKGLKYDKRNAACRFLIAARWIYAPAPFHNINKGINEMKNILSGSFNLQKEDYFNVYYSVAYAYNRSKKADEAKSWLEKALDIYPENKDALNLGRGRVRIAEPVNSVDSFNASVAE
jgi:tetratricopeptide (TPR) repeat protein